MTLRLNAALVSVALALGACNASREATPPPAKPSESPKAFLERIYQPYVVQDAAGIFQMTPEVLGQYFEPKLAGALLQTYTTATARGLDPTPKGDAFINAFRWHISSLDIKELRVEARDLGGGRATGSVSFKNFFLSKSMAFELVALPSGWRIADISYRPKQSLRRLVGLDPGGRAEQLTAAEVAARYRTAVLEGNVEAVAAMMDPSGIMCRGEVWVCGRDAVLREMKARHGDAYSTVFMSHRDYFVSHPEVTATLANWGRDFVEARWSETGHDPSKWTGPVVVLSRDFLGQAWIRALDDSYD